MAGDATTFLRTLDPADPDLSDLQPLREIVGDARVVCLGETAHAAVEMYHAKDRLFRYLVTELGFTALVLESGFAEGLAVAGWVAGGPGDVEDLSATGTSYEFWDVEPFRDQLRWMRERTASGHPVRFHGMDQPGAGVDPGAAVTACLDRLPARDGDDELRSAARLGGRFAAPRRWASLGPDGRERLRAGVGRLVERAAAAGDETARLCAAGASLVLSWLTDGPSLGPDHNPRDELMAGTVRWLLEHEDRIVVNAHNAHVQRHPLFGAPSLGTLLAPELGSDLLVIGTTRYGGTVAQLHPADDDVLRPASATEEPVPTPPDGSLDALMDSLGPLHMTDLRRLPQGTLDGVTTIGVQSMTVDVDPRAYDAIVHVREIHPVPGVVEAMQASIDRAAREAQGLLLPERGWQAAPGAADPGVGQPSR